MSSISNLQIDQNTKSRCCIDKNAYILVNNLQWSNSLIQTVNLLDSRGTNEKICNVKAEKFSQRRCRCIIHSTIFFPNYFNQINMVIYVASLYFYGCIGGILLHFWLIIWHVVKTYHVFGDDVVTTNNNALCKRDDMRIYSAIDLLPRKSSVILYSSFPVVLHAQNNIILSYFNFGQINR